MVFCSVGWGSPEMIGSARRGCHADLTTVTTTTGLLALCGCRRR